MKYLTQLLIFIKGYGYDDYHGKYNISRRRMLQFFVNDIRYGVLTRKNRLKRWKQLRFDRKNFTTNLWIFITPARRQTFLSGENPPFDTDKPIWYYHLFETPYGHLPYPLAWKVNLTKIRKRFKHFRVENRWQKLTYPCSNCREPVHFKNTLCQECFTVERDVWS